VVVVAFAALVSCSPNPNQKTSASTEPTQLEEGPLGPPVRWLCEDGRTLTTTFYGDRVTVAIYSGATHTLPAVVAASGEAYEADGIRFHAKGMTEAYLEEGGQGGKVTNCEASPKE
jgi:membrane-bound inhibitor of C-type lysozyme